MLAAPALGYRHEFTPRQAEAAIACLAEHGFVIVKGMLTPALRDALRDDVCRLMPPAELPAGGSSYALDFVERSPAAWQLLAHQPYLRFYATMLGTDDLCLHRSAAIVRCAGSGCGWHTDTPRWPAIDETNAVLNCSDEFPAGMWFYLNGSHPERGGLAVIAESHRPDWQPPAGYRLTPTRQFLQREDGSEAPMEVPGMVPLISEPEDLILFAARTYHAAFAHRGDAARLSCGVGLRQRRIRIAAPWPLPERARAFIASAPEHIRRFTDGYTGIEPGWRPAQQGGGAPER